MSCGCRQNKGEDRRHYKTETIARAQANTPTPPLSDEELVYLRGSIKRGIDYAPLIVNKLLEHIAERDRRIEELERVVKNTSDGMDHYIARSTALEAENEKLETKLNDTEIAEIGSGYANELWKKTCAGLEAENTRLRAVLTNIQTTCKAQHMAPVLEGQVIRGKHNLAYAIHAIATRALEEK